MNTTDRLAELKAMQEGLEAVAKAEAAATKAKAAYREHPTPKTKAAHRAASQALNDAREQTRGNDAPRMVAPGDVSITPGTVGK